VPPVIFSFPAGSRPVSEEGTDFLLASLRAYGMPQAAQTAAVKVAEQRDGTFDMAGPDVELTTEEVHYVLETLDRHEWPSGAEVELAELRAALVASLSPAP